MNAPRKFDYLCESLVMLIPILLLIVGGPAMLGAAFQQAGVPPETAARFVTLLPWWLPIAAAVLAGLCARFLMMCYPSLQLPSSANIAQVESMVQGYLTAHPQQSSVTVTTPNLGPEHPSTTVEVNGPPPAPVQPQVVA